MDAPLLRPRRGYCPGVWTPMASGDGLIVRVHTAVSPLTVGTLRALIDLAGIHGNGLIELTRRANLQLRGVRAEALAALQRALVELGLADASQPRERTRALISSDPLAGLDPGCAPLDGVAEALARALDEGVEEPAYPAKFAIVLDAGSGALDALSADLRVDLRAGCSAAHLKLGGDARGASFVGAVPVEALPRAVALLVGAFLARRGERRSIRALVDELGVATLASPLAGLPHAPCTCTAAASREARRSLIGFHAGVRPYLGVALPLGVGAAEPWHAVAALAERFGDGSVRCAPDRALVLPGIVADEAVAAQARAGGLIIDPRDPLLRTVACAGAPRCGAAYGETRALARALAETVLARREPSATLHVSGCAKSCAKTGPSDLTVLHAEDGVRLGFSQDVAQTARNPAISRETALQRLTAWSADDKLVAPMTRKYDYERDAAAIYRRSFAIIRAEAQLARFNKIEERVAVRLVHTSGMVELADDIVFTGGFAEVAAAAIARGAPILCDTKMVVSGVTRARLGAANEVISFVDHPEVPALAAAQHTTRTAAALTLWGQRLDGAVVAIGNAPTALFRLLELFDEIGARPAAVIGLPVGFVGAAESKAALVADGRVPAMIVRGRKGGSAMTAAAINALASEKE